MIMKKEEETSGKTEKTSVYKVKTDTLVHGCFSGRRFILQ